MRKMDGFVIILKDTDKVAGTSDIVFGKSLDVYLSQKDAEFVARTVYAERPLEVRRATVEVH